LGGLRKEEGKNKGRNLSAEAILEPKPKKKKPPKKKQKKKETHTQQTKKAFCGAQWFNKIRLNTEGLISKQTVETGKARIGGHVSAGHSSGRSAVQGLRGGKERSFRSFWDQDQGGIKKEDASSKEGFEGCEVGPV